MIQLRLAQLSDLPLYREHLRRHGQESGRDGDVIFSPYEEPWDRPLETLQIEKESKWPLSVTEPGWERCWILTDGNQIYGDLKLVHTLGLKTSLHRAILMMGIERSQRGKGWGKRMIETALTWASQQPSLDWVQLNVFAHNVPARRLYRSFGFGEVGTNRDLFRVYGQKIDDIEMSLCLKEKAPLPIEEQGPLPGQLHHIELYVTDLRRSTEFWGWLLSRLGYTKFQSWDQGESWKLGHTYLVFVQTELDHLAVPYHRKRTGLNHIALHAESREQVDQLKAALIDRGAKILYSDKYPHRDGKSYALYFEDPDRIKVELVAR